MLQSTEQPTSKQQRCLQAGYLPVPLAHVPPEGLARLEIFLYNGQAETYSLYRHPDLPFGEKDYLRLQESGVEYVFVSVQDHQIYSEAIEKALDDIVSDPHTQQERKSEILYSTGLELANQILDKPLKRREIDRTANVAFATVKMVMNDRDAFKHLYQVFNHDLYTASHMVNVCGLSISLAIKLGILGQEVLQRIGMGAMLHDIGKIFIPAELLNSTAKLDQAQHEELKQHVKLGYEHLLKVAPDVPEEILCIIAEHHERMDGSGYPKGLKGQEISPFGRLAGIVDSFEAMTSVRPYRDFTYTPADALQELRGDAPAKYDNEILQTFSNMMEDIWRKGEKPSTSEDAVEENSPAALQGQDDSNEAADGSVRMCFRVQILARMVNRAGAALKLDMCEKMVAHWLSRGNIGILSPRPLAVRQTVLIEGEVFAKIGLGKILAVVTSCESYGNGWFAVRLQLLKPVSQVVLNRLKDVTSVREMAEHAAR